MYGFTITNMSQAINWNEAVEEYHKSYDDEDGIHEYVEGLIPVIYWEINSAYDDYIGTPLGIEIEESDVGLSLWQIMTRHLFEHFMGHFMEAFNAYEEEEWFTGEWFWLFTTGKRASANSGQIAENQTITLRGDFNKVAPYGNAFADTLNGNWGG